MQLISLHDRGAIEAFLRRDIYLNLYEIGDLDDFFWPYTTWYGLCGEGGLRQVLLIYSGAEPPVLVGTAPAPIAAGSIAAGSMADLLQALRLVRPLLPARVYAHLSLGGETGLAPPYRCESHGVHHKMALTAPQRLEGVDTHSAVRLQPADLPALQALYAASYPGNWFDPRMLETGRYWGIWEQGRLVSVAGVHVYSPRYGVAALGNITTLPERRGRGLGAAVTAALCLDLRSHIPHIGLNVRADNAAAIACYRKLGFTVVGDYEEFMFTLG